MEAKINIAEILRNKPHGVKLYSSILNEIVSNEIIYTR